MSAAEQLRDLPRNTRWCAAYWIVSGERHPQEHWAIGERLVKWRQQAAGCRGELRDLAQSILVEFERDRAAEARPSQAWVMTSGRVTGLGPETDLAGADKIDAEAHAEVAGERKDRHRYHTAPRWAQNARKPLKRLVNT